MSAEDEVYAPTTREQLEIMLQVTGARDQLAQTMSNYKASIGKALGLFEDELDELFKDINTEKLLSIGVSVYEKHFTAHEVEAVIAFYSSPVGQSFIKKIGIVNKEVYEACQKMLDAEHHEVE
jgi:hypothetical protein